jgi:hypothetical protein
VNSNVAGSAVAKKTASSGSSACNDRIISEMKVPAGRPA